MVKQATVFFILGWGFYAIAEITPLFDSIGVWAALQNGTPMSAYALGWLAYDVMFDKPLLMLATVPAIFFLFLAFSYLRIGRLQRVGLDFLVTWTMILAIPDMIWPLGTIYYEELKYYFGVLSLLLAFVTILAYCFFVWSNRWTESQS